MENAGESAPEARTAGREYRLNLHTPAPRALAFRSYCELFSAGSPRLTSMRSCAFHECIAVASG